MLDKIRRFLFGPGTDFRQLVQDGAIIVDVRTPAEYRSGHIEGSVNIPLDRIGAEAEKLQRKGKPVITVCRSGNRSGMARQTLMAKGLVVYNGGAWNSLRQKIS